MILGIRLYAMLKYLFLSLLAITATHASEFNNSLKPFINDGCTMFVDGTRDRPTLWRHCCVEHDMRYWFGGSISDMDKTDLRLRSCVNEVAGKNWADLIYAGVRAGHQSPIKNKTHWSWGWEIERADIPLTSEEADYALTEIKSIPLDSDINPNLINQFIIRNFP